MWMIPYDRVDGRTDASIPGPVYALSGSLVAYTYSTPEDQYHCRVPLTLLRPDFMVPRTPLKNTWFGALLKEAFHLFVDPAPTQLVTRAEPLSTGLLPVP
jgi:hypothetical protein